MRDRFRILLKMVDRVNEILTNGGDLPQGATVDSWVHFDIFSAISKVLIYKHEQFQIRWHPGHLAPDDVYLGIGDARIIHLNDGADGLAKLGAMQHMPAPATVQKALRRMQLAECIQRMAIGVLSARHNAEPAPGRTGGYTERELLRRATGATGLGSVPASCEQLEHDDSFESITAVG